MKYLLLLPILCSSVRADQQTLNQQYFEKLDNIRDEYRRELALEILKADKVVLSHFDKALEEAKTVDPFQESSKPTAGLPSPKILNEEERKILLQLLAKQISDPKGPQAMCHNPIHKIEIFSHNELILESTFCWNCSNFTFEYPEGSENLPTSEALKLLFLKLMPITADK